MVVFSGAKMGEGLKRVAKLCGGLKVVDKDKIISYDADGNKKSIQFKGDKVKLQGKSSKTIIYYHERDFDGKCSGAIALKFYRAQEEKLTHNDYGYKSDDSNILQFYKAKNISLVGIDYGKEKLIDETFTPGDRVVMLDWSAPAIIMKKLQEESSEFIWIDHHGTAIDKVEETYPDLGIKGIRWVGTAGCELAWEYFYPNQKMPEVVRLLGRYDVYDKEAEDWDNILDFQYGFNILGAMLPEDLKWQELFEKLGKERLLAITEIGESIQLYMKTLNENHCRLSGVEVLLKKADGTGYYPYSIFALNTQAKSSQTFLSLKDKYDIYSAYTFNGDRWTISLYSTKLDVGKICKELGGGGHAGAAGFECDKFPFEVK